MCELPPGCLDSSSSMRVVRGLGAGGPGSGAGCSGELGRPSSVEGVTSATHGSPPPGLGAGPGLCEVTTPPQTGDMTVTQSDGHLLS